MPAIAANAAPTPLAHRGRRTQRRRRPSSLQKVLVVGQVALSVLLVGSATLLLRSYYNLTTVEPASMRISVMTFHVGARWDEDRHAVGQLQMQLLNELSQLPHVQAAGMTNFLPAPRRERCDIRSESTA